MDEWEDLAKEERLYKKLRRGKISKEEYNKLLHDAPAEEAGKNEDSDAASDSE